MDFYFTHSIIPKAGYMHKLVRGNAAIFEEARNLETFYLGVHPTIVGKQKPAIVLPYLMLDFYGVQTSQKIKAVI